METYEDIDFTYGEQPTESKWDQLGLNDKRFNEILTYGWQDPGETWTYASATTFTVSGDVTSIYEIGDKIRYKQGGAYKYGVITNKSYSSPNTTITISGEAITNATITDNYYSKENSPIGMGGIGVLGYAEATSPQAAISGETDLTGLTVTVTVPAGGGKIKITAQTSLLPSQANTIGYMYIKEGATFLGQVSTIMAATTVTQGVSCQVILTPTAGSHTYKLAAQCPSAPYTLTIDSATARPSFILVEYLGGA